MRLSFDQQQALNKLLNWYKSKNKSQFITLGGYAGTGKTTFRLLLFLNTLSLEARKEISAYLLQWRSIPGTFHSMR